MSGTSSEADLVQRCKGGDKSAFHPLVAPYLHSLGLIAYSIVRNPQDAEEVVQESILKAFIHIEQLRDAEGFKAWILQIAVNEARMRLRKTGIHRFVSIEGELQQRECQPRQLVEQRIPFDDLEQKELRAALSHALVTLNESYRTVFLLRDVQHLSSSETARILGISETAVDIRLHRARLKMREQLASFFKPPSRKWIPMSLRMMALMGKTMMRKVISCRRAMHEISNYIDQRISDELRKAIEEHLRLCDRCSAVLDTTRKIIYIAGDDQIFDLPLKCNYNWDQLMSKAGPKAPPEPA